MASGGGNFLANLPILDGKNYNHWVIKMEVILSYQELLEILKDGAREKDKATSRKKDCKACCLLHQCMDLVNFKKISKARTTKELGIYCKRCMEVRRKPRK